MNTGIRALLASGATAAMLAMFGCVGDDSGGPPDGSMPDASDATTSDAPAIDAAQDASDAGADVATTTYSDLGSTSAWSTFDTTTINTSAQGFLGAAFDGRYLYFVPDYNNTAIDGVVARYDTQAAFGLPASWSTFDATTVNANAKGFNGVVFDGRYVYFVPNSDGNVPTGVVARYDTTASFTVGGSWTTFDTTTVNAGAKGFAGGTFDGRYVYFVPNYNAAATADGIVTRYDTQATFGSASSWSTFDAATVDGTAKGFQGAVFDGRYVYFVPSYFNGVGLRTVARYDTTAPFATAGSWAVFDVGTTNANAKGFAGGAFDGRYVYLVPFATGAFNGTVARYDTTASFTSLGSWNTFDTSTVSAGAKGYVGAAFDGRYVYFVPNSNSSFDGILSRYDTTGSFAAVGSWSTFDTTTVNGAAKGFWGAAFDGRYVYLVPAINGIVTRFDAKTPASMPKLPGWFGSFY